MALLDVINGACDEIGINRPQTPVFSQTDRQTLQLLALLRRVGSREIPANFNWQSLITPNTITTIAGTPSYALPTDFDRFVDETQWNTSNKVPLFGPLNQKDWAQNEFGMINVGPYFRQQIRQGVLYLQPTPIANGQVINFYYMSKNWIRPAGSTTAARVAAFTADTDTFVYDDGLLISALIFVWKRAKGFDFSAEQDAYETLLASAKCDDRGNRSLSMDPEQETQGLATGFIVPITGFGQ